MQEGEMPRIAAAALMVALAGSAIGCGGSDKGSLPPKAFARQANAVCKRVGDETNAALAKAGEEYTRQHLTLREARHRAQQRVSAVQHRGIDQLGALEAPSGLQAAFKSYLAARRQQLAITLQAIVAPDPGARPRTVAAQRRSARLARALGLKSCG